MLFDLLGYLASFLTWLFLWLVFCICIDDFETKSSPKNKEDICIIIIVNAIHSLASKPNVFADYGLSLHCITLCQHIIMLANLK